MTARRGRWSFVALGALVAAWTMIGINAHATYGAHVAVDEPQYVLSAISVAEDGDLDISDELAAERYRPFHGVDLPRQTYPDEGGRELSPHDPLLPVLLAVPVWLGGWVAAKATIAVLAGALAATTAWIAHRRFGVSRPVSVAVTAAFACTAPLATYATQIYPEVPAALAVVVAVAAIGAHPSWRSLAGFVVAVVALPWLSVKYVLVAAALAAVALWRLRTARRQAVAMAAVLAVAGVVYLVVHRRLYGGWTSYATGDAFAESGELAALGDDPDYGSRSRRLVGLLVDDPFGLALWMPAWLLLPYAVGRAWRAALLVAPLAAGWLTATFVALTMHGWWWPGRQLVVVLPLAVIAIAIAADRHAVVRRFVAAGAVIGLATWVWTTVEAITRRRTLVVDFAETANPWVRLVRLVLPDRRDPAAVDSLLLAGWTLLVGWLAWSAIVGRGGQPALQSAQLLGADHDAHGGDSPVRTNIQEDGRGDASANEEHHPGLAVDRRGAERDVTTGTADDVGEEPGHPLGAVHRTAGGAHRGSSVGHQHGTVGE